MSDKILSLIGDELPTANVSRMVLTKSSIDVEILTRDQLDEQLEGTWFNNEKLVNLLKLVVVISKNPEVTDILSLGSDAVGLCDKTVGRLERESLAEEVIRLKKPRLLEKSRSGLKREKDRILRLIDNHVEVRILNLSKDFKGSVRDIIRSEKIEIDNTEVANIYYETKFELDQIEEHVSIFSYVKMDVRDFGETFGVDTSKAGLESFNGSVDLERVISSRKAIRRSKVFFKNGRPYDGSVRYSPTRGRYLTDSRGPNSVLITKTIRNPKIIDEREIMSIRQIQTEFRDLSLSVSSKNKVSRDNLQPKRVHSYFTPLQHTKDEEDNVRFLFSINTSNILLRNSVYGPLFSRLHWSKRKDILNRSVIENLEVRRVRVKPASLSSNRVGSEQSKGEVFDKNEPPLVLLRTGEKTTGEIQSVNNSQASFVEEEIFARGTWGMRTFSGVDRTFSGITDGFYQYEVTVEVTDTIQPYLIEQISELKGLLRELNEYYNFSILTGPTLEKAEISNPHIDLAVEAGTTEAPDKSHYEAYSNKFTRRFSKVARKRYGSPMNYPWITAPSTIIDLVSGFTSNFPEDRKSQMASSMRYSMSPITGNPTNILSIIKMVESFMKRVEDAAALPSKPTISSSTSESTTNKSIDGERRTPTKTFTASKRFDETFDSNMTRKFGFNYLDIDAGDGGDLGLKTISNTEYDDRIESENERFFSDQGVNINLTIGGKSLTTNDTISKTSHSFLTPVSFIDSGVVYDFLDTGEKHSRNNILRRFSISSVGKINGYSLLMERIVTDSMAKNVLERNSMLSDEYNFTISRTGKAGELSLYPPQVRDRSGRINRWQALQTIGFYDYLAGLKSEQIVRNVSPLRNRRQFKEREREINQSNPFRAVKVLSMGLSRSNSFKSNPMLRNKLRAMSRRSQQTSFSITNLKGNPAIMNSYLWSRLPNQLKALFLRKSDNSSTKVTGEFLEDMARNYAIDGFLEYKFTMGKLAKVMYLSGYSGTKPMWRLLTKRTYDNLSGKRVLCKVVPYSNRKLGHRPTPGFDLNVYNKVFVLDIQREIEFDGDELPLDDYGESLSQGGGDSDALTIADSRQSDSLSSKATKSDLALDYSKLSPKELEDMIRRGHGGRIPDDQIRRMNALQLSKIPESRRRRLSRTSTTISRGNMVCNLISDERESEENRNSSARTGVVPNRSMRNTDIEEQSGDVY